MPGLAVTTVEARLGFHGKIPTASDFVTRHLPRGFIEAWDLWLQQAILGSRDELGEDWLDTYLGSPVWRFALAPGVCGPEAFAGVLIPSVDRVGRYFPFALIAVLPPGSNVVRLVDGQAVWFDEIERLALSVLESDVEIDSLVRSVQSLPLPALEPDGAAAADPWPAAMRIGFSEEGGARAVLPDLLNTMLRQAEGAFSLWWTMRCHGDPYLLVCRGLPEPRGFVALLDSEWRGRPSAAPPTDWLDGEEDELLPTPRAPPQLVETELSAEADGPPAEAGETPALPGPEPLPAATEPPPAEPQRAQPQPVQD